MRATGEVMASAADLPTALAKAERAAGRALPRLGRSSSRSVPRSSAGAGDDRGDAPRARLQALRDRGTAGRWPMLSSRSRPVQKLSGRRPDELTVIDLIRRGRCDLVINTPEGRQRAPTDTRSARRRSRGACRASPRWREPRRPCTRSRTHAPSGPSRCRSGSMPRRERRSVVAAEPVGPYTLLRLDRGGLDPARRGSSSCSRRPGGSCRARSRSASRRPASSPSSSTPSVRARRRCARSSPVRRSTSSGRSATASGSTSSGRCSSAAGSALRRCRTSPRRSASRRRCSASAAPPTPRRRCCCPARKSRSSRRSSPS